MLITEAELRPIVSARVAEMPAHERAFWAAIDSALVNRTWARRLLDTAVEWIGEGRTDTADPYALALSWAVR